MNRSMTLIGALLAAFATIASTCVAHSLEPIRFTLEAQRGDPTKLHANFRHQSVGDGDNSWSTGVLPSDLIGFEASPFHAPGNRPVHFAIVREAGRLDCAGTGGGGFAAGTCGFSANPRFTQMLVTYGVGRPTPDQSFGLMAVNARHELIEALSAARYPTPRINEVMSLAALGVNEHYVADMSRAGYRPATIQKLVEFKALAITPQWIAGFVRAGYANLPGDGLVQMRALGITPAFIQGFDRIGYPHLPVATLVQLKALDITPEFVRMAVGRQSALPPVSKLFELKRLGARR